MHVKGIKVLILETSDKIKFVDCGSIRVTFFFVWAYREKSLMK